MYRRHLRFFSSVAALALTASAMWATARPVKATDDFADAAVSKVPYRTPLVRARMSCSGLVAQALGGSAHVVTAKLIGAAPATPAYCDVRGVIAPSILFDVALPVAWNERLYGLGNAGCGSVLGSNFAQRDAGLANGFAVALTDTGIENPTGTCAWAANRPDLVVDFAYAGIHETALAAKRLLQLYYARGPLASYYNGCSDGGHDGLEEVQKYPDDYEGVVAGAPLLGAGTIISNAWTTGTYARLPRAAPMTPAKVAYIARAVYAACDKLDGLVDGLIEDPQGCARVFDPGRDLTPCPAGTDGDACLTSAQLAAYQKARGPVISGGKPFYPGQPLGNEINLIGAQIAQLGLAPQTTHDYFLSDTYMQYLFPWPHTSPTAFGDFTFNFDRDPARIAAFRTLFDAANLDLDPFFARGGKLLSYHGWADPLITPYGTVAFYEDEEKLYGPALAASFRLYMVPGMGHCHGGPGAAQFDAMTQLIDWVEAHDPPQAILSRHLDAHGNVAFTRTLCAYPQIARFGGGNPTAAGSFRCVPGSTGVPGFGESGEK